MTGGDGVHGLTSADFSVNGSVTTVLWSACDAMSRFPIGKLDMASHADKSTVVTDPFTEKSAEVKP